MLREGLARPLPLPGGAGGKVGEDAFTSSVLIRVLL